MCTNECTNADGAPVATVSPSIVRVATTSPSIIRVATISPSLTSCKIKVFAHVSQHFQTKKKERN